MKAFIDWSFKKGYVVILNDSNPQILQTLDFLPETEVYVESSCPKFLLYNLIDKGVRIFISQSKETAHLRDELKIEKTDSNDTKILQQLYQKNPSLFIEMSKPSADRIKLKYLMGQYEVLTKVVMGFKNQSHWAEKEFGSFDYLKSHIKDLEKEKAKIVRSVKPLLITEIKLISIKGINTTLIARLLSQAHPQDFPTLSRWLAYCGYKGYMKKRWEKGKGNRPNFLAKSILHIMVDEIIRHRTPTYRVLYDQCKLRYQTEHPEWTKIKNMKGQAHRKAMNIVATYIAKEFWYKLHNTKPLDNDVFPIQDLLKENQKILMEVLQ